LGATVSLFWDKHCIVLRDNPNCPKATLGVTSQNPFGATWCCPKVTLGVTSHFPLGQLKVVPKVTLGVVLRKVLKQLNVVLGMNFIVIGL
jgi:hypothetical protein